MFFIAPIVFKAFMMKSSSRCCGNYTEMLLEEAIETSSSGENKSLGLSRTGSPLSLFI